MQSAEEVVAQADPACLRQSASPALPSVDLCRPICACLAQRLAPEGLSASHDDSTAFSARPAGSIQVFVHARPTSPPVLCHACANESSHGPTHAMQPQLAHSRAMPAACARRCKGKRMGGTHSLSDTWMMVSGLGRASWSYCDEGDSVDCLAFWTQHDNDGKVR